MKLLMLLLTSIIFTGSAFSQDCFVFKGDSALCPAVKKNECKDLPYLGKEVSVKYEQFNRLYTKKVDLGPPAYISSIEIEKPDVYYSIKKLSAYYMKSVKKGALDQEHAEKELSNVLDKCMLIFKQETKPVELELKAANNPEEILAIFQKIVIE